MNNFIVAFVIPYFGSWPSWFPIYLETCKRNPCAKFLIFTDCPIPAAASENVKFIRFSLSEFNTLASCKLGLNIQIRKAYKVCDFKPAFGHIFEDYLKGFQFWGNADIDTIWGNISRFINEEMLGNYDIITSRKEALVGHFTLYRNSENINLLYQESKDYKEVLTSELDMGFDECGFPWWPLLAGMPFNSIPVKIDSMTHVIKRAVLEKNIRLFSEKMVFEQDKLDVFGQLDEFKDILLWNNGHLINLNDLKEYLYFHFHVHKKTKLFKIPSWSILPNQFYISKQGLFTIEQQDSDCI